MVRKLVLNMEGDSFDFQELIIMPCGGYTTGPPFTNMV